MSTHHFRRYGNGWRVLRRSHCWTCFRRSYAGSFVRDDHDRLRLRARIHTAAPANAASSIAHVDGSGAADAAVNPTAYGSPGPPLPTAGSKSQVSSSAIIAPTLKNVSPIPGLLKLGEKARSIKRSCPPISGKNDSVLNTSIEALAPVKRPLIKSRPKGISDFIDTT